MEFLSLEQPEPRRGRQLTGVEAQIASLVLHLLAALLILFLPQHLPESVRAFFRPSPPPLPSAAAPAASEAVAAPPKPAPRIPLQFAYSDPSVRVPDDRSVKENPKASILSNRNRIARQEVPTPPGARRDSIDPHSEGNTIARVRPDPSRPEGPESVEPPPAEAPQPRGAAGLDESARAAPGDAMEAGGPGTVAVEGAGTPAFRPPGRSGNGLPAAGSRGVEGPPVDPQLRVREMLQEVQSGETKDTFYNPTYLRDGALGTMSFDTKDFPWGDYDRQVYVKIDNNWRERTPLAAREGLRGYLCAHYVWRRDGTITDIEIVRPSSIPPFNKAVLDALRASSPLPPLPESFPRDSEGATACFFYNMWPGEVD